MQRSHPVQSGPTAPLTAGTNVGAAVSPQAEHPEEVLATPLCTDA